MRRSTSVRKMHWKLDAANRTATHTSDTPLGLNSFVKSYIVGHAADAALGVAGVRGVVVNIGGDLVVRGDLSEQVSIADPNVGRGECRADRGAEDSRPRRGDQRRLPARR